MGIVIALLLTGLINIFLARTLPTFGGILSDVVRLLASPPERAVNKRSHVRYSQRIHNLTFLECSGRCQTYLPAFP